jgi:hypothetical protein
VCGELGWTPERFYDLLYCELVLILEGRAKRMKDEAAARKSDRLWMGAAVAALMSGSKDAIEQLFGSPGKRRAKSEVWQAPTVEGAKSMAAHLLGTKSAEVKPDGSKG